MKPCMQAARMLVLQALVLAALAAACHASVLRLKNGGTIEGEVLKADEEFIQIKSGDKLLEIEWKELAEETLKEFHPVIRAEEQRKREERRKLEERRKREEKRKLEEERRLREQRKQEEEKKLEEARRLEELRKKEEGDGAKPVTVVRQATITGAFKPLGGLPMPQNGTSVYLVKSTDDLRSKAESLRREARDEVERMDAEYAKLARDYSRAAAERVSAVNAQQWDKVNEISESCRGMLAEQERLSRMRKDEYGGFPGAVRELYRENCRLEGITGGDGSFTFTGVAPGQYIVFSVWEPGGLMLGVEQAIDVPEEEGSRAWDTHESAGIIKVEPVAENP